MSATAAEHGTYAMYVTAKCRCDACRDATAAYQREYRRRNPGYAEQVKRQNAAYMAAMRQLRERYRDEFDAIYTEELARHGMPRLRDLVQ